MQSKWPNYIAFRGTLGETPLLFVVTPDEILIYNNYKAPQSVDGRDLDPTVGIIETLSLADGYYIDVKSENNAKNVNRTNQQKM